MKLYFRCHLFTEFYICHNRKLQKEYLLSYSHERFRAHVAGNCCFCDAISSSALNCLINKLSSKLKLNWIY